LRALVSQALTNLPCQPTMPTYHVAAEVKALPIPLAGPCVPGFDHVKRHAPEGGRAAGAGGLWSCHTTRFQWWVCSLS